MGGVVKDSGVVGEEEEGGEGKETEEDEKEEEEEAVVTKLDSPIQAMANAAKSFFASKARSS